MWEKLLIILLTNFPSDNQIFIAELAAAVRADNHMKFGLYHSLFEWYNPMYVSDRNSEFSQNEFVQKKVKETNYMERLQSFIL